MRRPHAQGHAVSRKARPRKDPVPLPRRGEHRPENGRRESTHSPGATQALGSMASRKSGKPKSNENNALTRLWVLEKRRSHARP